MRARLLAAGAIAALILTLAPTSAAAAGGEVVIPRGSTVQIAVVLPDDYFVPADVGASAWNAVQLAVEKHPKIRGFSVQLNLYTVHCLDPVASAAVADQIVANPQNVGVVGHACSAGFIGALPIYQTAGVVVLSGSASAPCLPSFGPDVFNDVSISDGTCGQPVILADAWYTAVSQLRSDLFWRQHTYQNRFGAPPTILADLFYDAASVMLDNITHTAKLASDGSLVIDRTLLAHAVRATTNFKGVTGNITLMANGFRVNTLGG